MHNLPENGHLQSVVGTKFVNRKLQDFILHFLEGC